MFITATVLFSRSPHSRGNKESLEDFSACLTVPPLLLFLSPTLGHHAHKDRAPEDPASWPLDLNSASAAHTLGTSHL